MLLNAIFYSYFPWVWDISNSDTKLWVNSYRAIIIHKKIPKGVSKIQHIRWTFQLTIVFAIHKSQFDMSGWPYQHLTGTIQV